MKKSTARRQARKAQPWHPPADIQNYPKAGGQRIQIRGHDGRCRIVRAGKADWAEVKEWRWA